jgi:hypothetical protein
MSDTQTGRKSNFFVWRRSDGYVGCNRGSQAPRGGTIAGVPCTFVELLETSDWSEAHAMLVAERGEEHNQTISSWDETSWEAPSGDTA